MAAARQCASKPISIAIGAGAGCHKIAGEQAMGRTSSATTTGTGQQHAASKAAPSKVVRRAHCRRIAPENQYHPHVCNNCGQTFIPQGLGKDFCGGECRHSFAWMR
ncbi:unnamed protein product, partial [Ectocarpus sp. 8 AP-2014]